MNRGNEYKPLQAIILRNTAMNTRRNKVNKIGI